MTKPSALESLFFAALEKPALDERIAFLNDACGGDDELRGSVERLLAAQAKVGDFLERPAIPGDATILHEPPITERPGAVIGPYKLLQQIGEGGMGVVFMAEQTQPLQRTVALKIIKPGMDTRHVIARFEAERQTLALMDHANIARVIDAGATDTGRPYFVMDLVKGVPITQYCDQQHLSIRERLELMTAVCQGVQHAHQKGIIHRDLKPSNVLVAEYDGRPVPKIIDFGVAKATAQKLTERTMFTEFGQLIGTFEYMSPEQARFNQLDVDTRSDVYSLGVLLYEVLAGSTPLEKERLRTSAFDELLRIICEEEPQRPSLRLSSSQLLPSISANRHSEPAKLKKLVRGELDWIVMKCLEKDRNRRYGTASGLAVDLQRYLTDVPVEARPATRAYRLRKFARRNKAGVLAGSTIMAARTWNLAAEKLTDEILPATDVRSISRDGRLLAAVDAPAAGGERSVKIWDTASSELRYRVPLPEYRWPEQVCISPDGRFLATSTSEGPVLIWPLIGHDPSALKPLRIQFKDPISPQTVKVHGMAFSPDSSWLAAAGSFGTVNLYNVKSNQIDTLSKQQANAATRVGFSSDGRLLAWGDDRGSVSVLDLEQREVIAFFTGHEGAISALAFFPDAQTLAVGCLGTIRLWDLPSKQERFMLRVGPHETTSEFVYVSELIVTPDGRTLISVQGDGSVRIWKYNSAAANQTLTADVQAKPAA